MNWGEIRDLVVQRLSEYNAGAAASSSQATFTDATIYSRMGVIQRRLVRQIAERNEQKVATTSTVSYTADAEYVTLTTEKWRDVFSVERLLDTGTGKDYEQLDEVNAWQAFRNAEALGMSDRYRYRIENDRLYVMPRPKSTMTLRLRYLAELASPSAAQPTQVPSFIPSEHHEYLALCVARSFLNETTRNASLDQEYAELKADFDAWAAGKPKRGPRFVHEYDE